MSSPHKPPLPTRLRRWLAAVLATLVIALAILVGLFRLLVPQVSEYRDVIAQWAGDALGAPVEIAEIDVRWRWLVPEVVLEDVILHPGTRDVHPLQAEEIAIRISPLDLMRPGPMRPGRVILRGGEFALRRDSDGWIHIPGLPRIEPGAQAGRETDWRTALGRVLANADYRVEASRLRLRDDMLNIGPWEVTIVHASLHSRGENHRFRGQLVLPDVLGGGLTLDARAGGAAGEPEAWEWQATLDAEVVSLAPLSSLVEWQRLRPLDGGLEARLQLGGDGVTVSSMRGDLALLGVDVMLSEPALRALGADAVARDIRLQGIDWQVERQGWRLIVADMDFSPRERQWPTSRLELRLREQRVSGSLRYARIQDLASLARLVITPDEPMFTWLNRLRPEGEVRDLLGALRFDEGELQDYNLRGRLTGLGMHSWEKIPGFAGLSGWLRADSNGGRMDVDAGPVHFDYPDLFRERLSAQRLQTTVEWSRSGDAWRLEAGDIRARNADARTTADLALDFRPDEPIWIRFSAEVPEARSDNLSDYLPVGRMPDTAVDWLDDAVQGGVVSNGRVLLDGPTRPFPYRNGEGRFAVTFDVEDGQLAYESGYPPLRDVAAHVRFEQAGMSVRGHRGTVAGYRIESATARIDDFAAPVLRLEGEARGGLADGLDFLRDSPLSEWFASPLEPVHLDGDVALAINLDIPLEAAAELSLDGLARLDGVGGEVDWLPGVVSDLAGSLYFTEEGARSDELRGSHLGHPFHVAIDPGSRGRDAPADARRETVATLRGGVMVDRLRAALPDYALLDWLEGEFPWRGEVRVPNEPGDDDIQVSLASGLEGLAVKLPAPAGKVADEYRPMQLRFPVGGSYSRVEAEYGDLMALTLDVAIPADAGAHVQGLRVDVGQDVGETRSPTTPAPGIAVHGQAETLDLGAWLGVDWPTGDEEQEGLALETLDIQADELLAGRFQLRHQHVRLDRRDQDWQVRLDGEDARGELRIPLTVASTRSAIQAELQRLNLRPMVDGEAAPVAMNPSAIPAMDVQVQALSRGGVLLGSLDLGLLATPDGIATERLRLAGADLDADLDAEWRWPAGEEQQGRVRGEVETRDVAAAMNGFGFLPGVEGSFGRLEGDLRWRGPPGPAALNSLSGTARLELRSGQLQEVNPGAGRVFGLLSFSALPRRLYGDFRDVFGRGLRFDRIQGDFVLANGDAYTGNLKLEGPVADVELIGRTGLVSRDYDQLLRVETQVGSALPVAGAIAGGVGVGAAMLVLSELFRGPLARMGRLEYRIDGSWEAPRVTPLDEEARRALDQDQR